jgi:hypothetical protein
LRVPEAAQHERRKRVDAHFRCAFDAPEMTLHFVLDPWLFLSGTLISCDNLTKFNATKGLRAN